MVRAHIVAAASRAVIPLVNRPPVDSAVLGACSGAVIIGVPTPDGPRVLSLLAPTATGVPNGVRCAAVGADMLTCDVRGDAVTVGGGRVLLDGIEVRVVRSWRCRVPTLTAGQQSTVALSDMIIGLAASKGAGVPEQFVVALDEALTSTLEAAAAALPTTPMLPTPPVTPTAPAMRMAAAVDSLGIAVRRLVGRGRGLTPAGDDVIAGALCGLHATGATAGARLLAAAAVDDITERTTLLSADLLRHAADGDACLEVLAVLRAAQRPRDILRHNESALRVAIDRLLGVGHTSGADLATGLAIGLRVGSGVGMRERAEAG